MKTILDPRVYSETEGKLGDTSFMTENYFFEGGVKILITSRAGYQGHKRVCFALVRFF
jgi:hypothetical protein